MENNSLDKFIKEQLIHLDGGEPLDSWDLLNEKLDANLSPTSSEDLAFDEKIKNSLVDLSIIEMADWENFLPSLELDENLVEIDTELNIDNTFKDNLNNLQADYDPSTWDALSTKLDIEDASVYKEIDAELDQVAYDKLLNYTVPQRAGEWEVFEKQLDKEFVLPYKLLFKYKLAEVAILASLILIFFQAKPLIENREQVSNEFVEQQNVVSSSVSTIAEVTDYTSSVALDENLNIDSGNNTPTKPKAKSNIESSFEGNVASTAKLSSIQKTNPTYNSIYPTPVNSSPNLARTSDPEETILTMSSTVTAIVSAQDEQSIKEEAKQLVVVDENKNTNESQFGFNQASALDIEKKKRRLRLKLNLAKLPIGSLASLDFKNKEDVKLCKSCYNLGSLLRWRLGAQLDVKYDYIMTAYDNIFNLESYNHSTFAYGAGLSTSILLGKWELESGFNYATRQYSPKTQHEFLGNLTKGYLKVKLDKIQMNILSIPLNLRYHFKDKITKTHFYMHAGATMNVATHANYFIKSDFLVNSKRPGLNETKDLVDESNTTSDKIYSLGWFEGGSYLENRYYSANLGLGFERKISSRYSIFGQTTYSHFLERKGLGPNDDRFNSVSISTGIRALFK